MASQTFSAHSATAALMKADEVVGKVILWKPKNEEQERFLKEFFPACRSDVPKVVEITSTASWSPKRADDMAKAIGAKRKLKKLDESDLLFVPMYVAGKLDVLVKWSEGGNPEAVDMTRERDKFCYPGVSIEDGGVSFYQSEGHPHAIACLSTESPYSVYLTQATEELAGLDLFGHIVLLHHNLRIHWGYSGVKFPMVDFTDQPDISWFAGMNAPIGEHERLPTTDNWVSIMEALQDNILRMDEVGARVVSVTRMGMGLIGSFAQPMPPPPLIIEEAFYFWLVRNDCQLPLFAAYVEEEKWKKPKSLTDL
ncbi:MAG: hypothetical protein M1324_02925 [Patescibacteria group bacterium]|nr:hypothetical protein [Patescibacteria group bacterium]